MPLPQLPGLTMPPGKDLVLGTTLKDPRDIRMPLSRDPLVTINEKDITRDKEPKTWEWDSQNYVSTEIGIWTQISSFFAGVGAGAGFNFTRKSDEAVVITSKTVKVEYFSPDEKYFQALSEEPLVSMYASKKWLKHPPVYLVTAIMTAEEATFENTKGKDKGNKHHIKLDTAGVASLDGKADKASGSNTGLNATVKEPFILAVELYELRLKGGSHQERRYAEHAKFDDRVAEKSFDDKWGFSRVEAEKVWRTGQADSDARK